MDDTGEIAGESDRQIIRREGEYWTISFGGVTCRLRDGRGLHHLALLLTHPGAQVSALALERSDGDSRQLDQAPVAPHDARERARVNVTRAITTVLKRLGTHHPMLARHLGATIKTGTFCSYTPDERLPARWTR